MKARKCKTWEGGLWTLVFVLFLQLTQWRWFSMLFHSLNFSPNKSIQSPDIMGWDSDIMGWDSDIMGWDSDIMGWHSDIMGWHSDIIGWHSDIMGWHSDIMGWHSDIMGWQWHYGMRQWHYGMTVTLWDETVTLWDDSGIMGRHISYFPGHLNCSHFFRIVGLSSIALRHFMTLECSLGQTSFKLSCTRQNCLQWGEAAKHSSFIANNHTFSRYRWSTMILQSWFSSIPEQLGFYRCAVDDFVLEHHVSWYQFIAELMDITKHWPWFWYYGVISAHEAHLIIAQHIAHSV